MTRAPPPLSLHTALPSCQCGKCLSILPVLQEVSDGPLRCYHLQTSPPRTIVGSNCVPRAGHSSVRTSVASLRMPSCCLRLQSCWVRLSWVLRDLLWTSLPALPRDGDRDTTWPLFFWLSFPQEGRDVRPGLEERWKEHLMIFFFSGLSVFFPFYVPCFLPRF